MKNSRDNIVKKWIVLVLVIWLGTAAVKACSATM